MCREQVAAWAGCTTKTVDRAARLGLIVVRPGERSRGMPSLDRDTGHQWALECAAERQASAERRAHRVPAGPPDDEHVWLDTAAAAVLVGYTVPWMRHLAEVGRAPATRAGRHWWWRRDLTEAYAAARAATRTP